MNSKIISFGVLTLGLLGSSSLTACFTDPGSTDGSSSAGTDTTGDGDGDGDGDEVGDGDGDGDGDEVGDGDGETPPDPFIFGADEPAAYTRVDRMGMPGVSLALITSKDAYNAADPVDDANGDFIPEFVANVQAVHMALDPALAMATLVPCGPSDCLLQSYPVFLPDTLKLNLAANPGFPNGRMLPDPVMDITLAVILLDLDAPDQDATTLIGTNPVENDVDFLADFPFLAPPN